MPVENEDNLEQRTDEALMLRFLDGELKAFENLFKRYSNLTHYVNFRVGNAHTAEDIVQKAWLNIINSSDLIFF